MRDFAKIRRPFRSPFDRIAQPQQHSVWAERSHPSTCLLGACSEEQGELGVAERYLVRAASLSSASATAVKAAERRTTGIGLGCEPAKDWLALTEFYSKSWTNSARETDALVRWRMKGAFKVRPPHLTSRGVVMRTFVLWNGRDNSWKSATEYYSSVELSP